MRRLLAVRDVRLYVAGQALSMLGDSALWLAMGIWVKQLTGSSAAAGLTWMAFMAPQLASPAAGLLADRVRRRPLLLAVNLATAVAVLPLLLVRDSGDVWMIYAVMVAYGASNAVMGAAQPALLCAVVREDQLPDINGVLQTAREGLRLVTPLAGAGLFAAAGADAVILLDAATFLAAASGLALMRVREPAPDPPERHPLAEAAAGFRHLVATPVLRRVIVCGCVSIVAYGLCETALFAVVDDGLHRPATFLGVLIAVQGAAAIASGLVAAPVLRRVGESALCGLGLGLFALACPLLAAPAVAVVLAGSALMGCGLPWVTVAANTLLQRQTPLPLLGRVAAAAEMVIAIPQIGSIAAGAVLVAHLDYRVVLAAMALLLLAGAAPLVPRAPALPRHVSG